MNPVPHIRRSPFGMVVVPILSFFLSGFMIGWASTPYNPYWAARHPHRAALMSLAGPAANLALVLMSYLGLKAGLYHGVFSFEGSYRLAADANTLWYPMCELLSIFFTLNIILAVFNLIPFPPLDGADGVLIFFPENKALDIKAKLDSLGFFGLFIGYLIFSRIAGPILGFAWGLV